MRVLVRTHTLVSERQGPVGANPYVGTFSRTPWQGDEDSMKRISKQGMVNEEGYVNVASELGLSGVRDHSSYHQPWVRRNLGYY